MAASIGFAALQIIPSIKGLAGELDSQLSGPIANAAKKAGDEAGKSLKLSASQAGTEFTKLGVGGLAVAGVIGAGLLKAGDAASNLGESVNAVRVTFGDAADGVLDLGKNAATTMGLSSTAFNGLAVQFSAFATTIAGQGGDVVGTMKDLTQRAADFGSVMNVDIPEAAAIFQSALAGETEPIRKFGIDLSAVAVGAEGVRLGLAGTAAQMTEADKVQARYSLLMQATAKDQGDFANTSDGLANSTRIAKAEMDNAAASIGTAVIPALTFAATAAATLAGGFTDLNDKTGGWLAKGAGIAALAIGAASAMSLVVGQALKMHERFTKVGDAFTSLKSHLVTSEGGLSKMGTAAKGAGVAMGLLALGVLAYELNAQSDADTTKHLGESLDKLGHSSDVVASEELPKLILQWKLFEHLSTSDALDKMAVANLGATIRMRDLAASSAETRDKLGQAGITVDQLTAAIDREAGAQKQATANTDKATAATADTTKATDALTAATELSGDALIQQGLAAGLTIAANDRARAFEDALKKSTDDAAKAAEDQRQAWEDSLSTIGDYTLAIDGVAKGYDDYKQKVIDAAKAVDDAKTPGDEKAQALRDERDAQINLAKSMDDAAVKYAIEQGAVAGSDAAHSLERDALIRMQDQYPLLRDQIQLYIDKLNEVPAVKNTMVTVNGRGDVIGQRTGAQAAGTDSWRGGLTWVGEKGPELIDLPRGTEVFSNAASRQMMAGATVGQSGNASQPITVNNYRRDINVADLNHVLAMARLAS